MGLFDDPGEAVQLVVQVLVERRTCPIAEVSKKSSVCGTRRYCSSGSDEGVEVRAGRAG